MLQSHHAISIGKVLCNYQPASIIFSDTNYSLGLYCTSPGLLCLILLFLRTQAHLNKKKATIQINSFQLLLSNCQAPLFRTETSHTELKD